MNRKWNKVRSPDQNYPEMTVMYVRFMHFLSQTVKQLPAPRGGRVSGLGEVS